MARAQHMDSAGSQFFLMHKNSPHLDGLYAGFGKTIEGYEVIDAIANCKTDMRDRPVEEVVIEKVTVDLGDYVPVEPQKI
jgi:peptidyl-prolyl cis-trans isomerase B (cyclophilin B)